MRPAALFLLLSLLILPLACVSSNRRGEPFTRAIDVSDPKLALGQHVFYEHCNICHPGGSAGYGASLNAKYLPIWYIKLRVRNGLGAMPPFDENHLTSPELDAVALFVQARP